MGWRSRKNTNPESAIESKLAKAVKSMGGLCYKFTSPGSPGVPDRIIITKTGRVIFAELKAEYGSLQKVQEYRIAEMQSRGVDVRIVKGEEQLKALVEELSNAV